MENNTFDAVDVDVDDGNDAAVDDADAGSAPTVVDLVADVLFLLSGVDIGGDDVAGDAILRTGFCSCAVDVTADATACGASGEDRGDIVIFVTASATPSPKPLLAT